MNHGVDHYHYDYDDYYQAVHSFISSFQETREGPKSMHEFTFYYNLFILFHFVLQSIRIESTRRNFNFLMKRISCFSVVRL